MTTSWGNQGDFGVTQHDAAATYRERAVACLIAKHGGRTPSTQALVNYGPAEEAVSMQRRLEKLAALTGDERAAAVAEQLAGLRAAEDVVRLSEIHPSWLVDILVHETPRVIGLLLRFLPSRHARFILDHLPRALKEHLPHVVDAFAVPEQILRIVRRRFERHFLPMHGLEDIDQFDSHTIHALSMDDLVTLFHDLGIQELAMAFCRVSRTALRVLFNRLKFDEAKALLTQIESLRSLDPYVEQDAKYSILEMSLEGRDPETMIREIGIQAFAKSLLPTQLPMVALLKQKLPPALAYLLQRDADIHVPTNDRTLATARQRLALIRVGTLAREAKIDPKWWRLLPETVRQDPMLVQEATVQIRNEHEPAEIQGFSVQSQV